MGAANLVKVVEGVVAVIGGGLPVEEIGGAHGNEREVRAIPAESVFQHEILANGGIDREA
jgi:hypothetical protein